MSDSLLPYSLTAINPGREYIVWECSVDSVNEIFKVDSDALRMRNVKLICLEKWLVGWLVGRVCLGNYEN